MSEQIRNIIDTPEKETLLITALENYIKKCRSLANTPLRGYGKATEYFKKEQWALKADEIQELLNDIVIELN